ncbi:MAG: HAD-IA family hydrolase [Clostridia bacterium]|nr:HAD-IA family hydrolase [Clostridia bacterium]
MDYEYIFFDFDGTLVNTVEGTAKSAQYALNQLSINTDNIDNLGRIFCGPPLKESFSKFLTDENDIKRAIELYKKYQAENTIELSKIYNGIKELLERLKEKGKSLNVVTLKSKETTIKILEFLGIYQYFDNIIGMCNEFPNQNKKEMLKYVTQKIDSNKAIMIGDRKSDIEAGNYCKIDTIAVLYGMDSFEVLSTVNPTYFAKDANEIYKVICQEK